MRACLPPEDPALKEWKLDALREAGLHIMGRATYEEMAEAWPSSDSAYAPVMNDIPKVVLTSTGPRGTIDPFPGAPAPGTVRPPPATEEPA